MEKEKFISGLPGKWGHLGALDTAGCRLDVEPSPAPGLPAPLGACGPCPKGPLLQQAVASVAFAVRVWERFWRGVTLLPVLA